ncbi:hypothetical protein Tco_1273016 [Tanacetum coccineum]
MFSKAEVEFHLDISKRLDVSRVAKLSHESNNFLIKWRILKFLTRTVWANLEHLFEGFHIKRITLLVHLEFDGVLVIGNSSLKFMHVDGRNIGRDQECLIKGCERKDIQCNLKSGFLGLESGAQSVVVVANP